MIASNAAEKAGPYPHQTLQKLTPAVAFWMELQEHKAGDEIF